jgi:predicted DNA-binding transcriptional regulator YafY
MSGILSFVLQTSARLLRLLTLLQARATWAGVDLADRLEVTARTLRRDVDRLRSLGYPIESTTGAAGGYRLGAGAALPPLSLDEDEATAVFVGLHAAASSGVAGADSASLRALTKLERVLPSRLKRKLVSLRTSVLKLADKTPPIKLSDVSTLAGACADRRVTELRYAGRDGAITSRVVEPFRIVHVAQRFYLVAWDTGKSDWRTFRLDRIRDPAPSQKRFAARPPPADDVVRWVTESLSSSPYRYRARVLLHASPAELSTRVGTFEGVVEPVSKNRCVLTTGAHSLDGLAVHVALLGVDFEILEPEELRPHVAAIGARLLGSTRRSRVSSR